MPVSTSALIYARGWLGQRGQAVLWGPVDICVCPGDVLHVTGANGCGKTTLLRMLAGLRQPPAGAGAALSADVWWIGHQAPLAESLSAVRNLRLLLDVAGVSGLNGGALQNYLAGQGVTLRVPVRQLSAGQRRKVALAALALAPRPLWLLDEPFDALDTSACRHLSDLACAHVARGGSIVLTSHQPLPSGFPPCKTLVLRPPDIFLRHVGETGP